MKAISESLTDLAGRVKKLEDAAEATREENRTKRAEQRTKMRERRQEVEDDLARDREEFRAAMAGAGDRVQLWWADVTAPVERRVDAMRADFAGRKAEHEVKKALRAADEAEEDAAAAIAFAAYCVNAAEYAVVQAALARAEADALVDGD